MSKKSKSKKSEAPIAVAPEVQIDAAPIVAPEATAPVAALVVKRVIQSVIVGADTAHDDDMKRMTARVHALNLGRDLFGARLNSRTADVNTALMLASAPQSVKLLEARSLAKNVSNDLRAKSNGAITVANSEGAKIAPVVVHELNAWRLSDDALRIVKAHFADAPCLVMLKDTQAPSTAPTSEAPVAVAPVKKSKKSK